MKPERDMILQRLRQVKDPSSGRDIVSLGMIKEIAVEEGCVRVALEFAGEAAPNFFQEAIEKALAGQVETVRVEVTRKAVPGREIQPVAGVARVLAVASGKGGVGKTTAAVNLALAFSSLGLKTGLMDADIYGPNVPLMLGMDASVRPGLKGEKLLPLEHGPLKVMSMANLVESDQPMVWRGPMLHQVIVQFLHKVEWAPLDVLVVDLPPGTGDVQISLVHSTPLAGAVIVTTPQEVALADVRKAVLMFRKTAVPVLGIIENMTGEIFGAGGAEKLGKELGLECLVSVPLDAAVRRGGDAGKPVVESLPESLAGRAFISAAEKILSRW
jgi:ATP-binding protein involved in chromosome partitioning